MWTNHARVLWQTFTVFTNMAQNIQNVQNIIISINYFPAKILTMWQFLEQSSSLVSVSVFSARCNIYISHLCYDVSVHLSVMEVHWRIIAKLGFKFRSQFTVHWGRSAREGIIAGKSGGIILRYASHC